MSNDDICQEADALRERIDRLEELRRSTQHAQIARTRAEQLCEPAELLRIQVQRLAVFREYGVAVSLPRARARDLLDHTQRIHAAFQSDPNSLFREPDDSSFKYDYLLRLESLSQKVSEEIAIAWKKHLAHLAPIPHEDLLDVLSEVPGFSRHVEDIRSTQRTLTEAQAQVPQSSEEIVQGFKTAKRLSLLWEELTSDEITPEILEFVREAVSSRGARLSSLSDPVKEWLEKHRLYGDLRVRL